jgi:hypothetical protein
MNEYTTMRIGRPRTTVGRMPLGMRQNYYVSEVEVGTDTLKTGRHATKERAEAALIILLRDHIFDAERRAAK